MLQGKTSISLAILAMITAGISQNAMAEGDFAKDHPRRAEVNHRLNNQNARIHNEVKEGDMSPEKAERIHREDHRIHQEERHMAAEHGGAITTQEQATLNRQENRVSRQIGQ